MRALAIGTALGLALMTWAGGALADEKFERKGRGEWKYEYKDRARELTRERKAEGEWKEEYKDARCEVKRERKSSGEYKEEIKCK
jgi:hypothetical protein